MGNRRFGLDGFLLIASILTPVSVLPLHAATKRPFIQKRYLRVISGGSVSVTFKKPNAAGNLIVAYVVWDNAGDGVDHRQPRATPTTARSGPTQATGDTSSAQIFYARNIAGGPNTVTATFATADHRSRGALHPRVRGPRSHRSARRRGGGVGIVSRDGQRRPRHRVHRRPALRRRRVERQDPSDG